MKRTQPRKRPIRPGGPRNMANTLVKYATPLIDALPYDYTADELAATLRFAAAVWNAAGVRDIRAAVGVPLPPRARMPLAKKLAAVRRMLTRKEREFIGDDHYIASITVTPRPDTPIWVTALGVCPDARCCGPQAKA